MCLLLPAPFVSAQPNLIASQVSPSAWFVEGASALGTSASRNCISNAGFVVTATGVVVIDALGSPQLARDLMAKVRRVSYLRETMGKAAREMEPFDEAYARTDWSRFERLPLFRAANRMNAYNTYLLMEREDK